MLPNKKKAAHSRWEDLPNRKQASPRAPDHAPPGGSYGNKKAPYETEALTRPLDIPASQPGCGIYRNGTKIPAALFVVNDFFHATEPRYLKNSSE